MRLLILIINMVVCFLFVCLLLVCLVATFRVARLTLQTRKLWLVGVATDRDAPLASPNVKNPFKNEKKRKKKKTEKNEKNVKNEKMKN